MFLGLGNYQKLLGDQQFWAVFGQTVGFAAVCVVGTLLVGAVLASWRPGSAPGPG